MREDGHGVNGEQGRLRIKEMLKKFNGLPVELLKSIIVEDVTSDSTMLTSDEKDGESSVLVVLDGSKLIKKNTSNESSSGTSRIGSYRPRNKEQNGKYEESHQSDTIPNSCMLGLKNLQSTSRISSSPSKTRKTITISESLCPISNVLDEECSDEEEEDKP